MSWTIEELLAASKKAAEAKAAAQVAAAGAAEAQVEDTGAAQENSGAAKAAEVAAATAGKEGETTGKEAETAKVEEVDKGAAVAAVAAPDLSALVTKVTELSIENAKVTAERDSMLASCAALAQIAGDSLSRMNIALGGGKVDVSAMTPESLVAQHATVAAQFASRFPTGGVAAVGAGAEAAAADAKQADPMHARRMAAVIGTHKKD